MYDIWTISQTSRVLFSNDTRFPMPIQSISNMEKYDH